MRIIGKWARSLKSNIAANKVVSTNFSTSSAVSLNYRLHFVRWHMDTRTPVCFLLLHDYLSSSDLWSPFVSAVAEMPKRRLSPNEPLALYAVDLRNHGDSPHTDDNSLLVHAQDVVQFAKTVITEVPVLHLVGHGFGARVAVLCALAAPNIFSGVSMIVPPTQDVIRGTQNPHPDRLKRMDGLQIPLKVSKEEALASGVLGPNDEFAPVLLSNLREVTAPTEPLQRVLQWRSNPAVLKSKLSEAFADPLALAEKEKLSVFDKPAFLLGPSKSSPQVDELKKWLPQLQVASMRSKSVKEVDNLVESVLESTDLLGDAIEKAS